MIDACTSNINNEKRNNTWSTFQIDSPKDVFKPSGSNINNERINNAWSSFQIRVVVVKL